MNIENFNVWWKCIKNCGKTLKSKEDSVEYQCFIVYGHFLVIFLQFFSCFDDFVDSIHRNTCTNKLYNQPASLCDYTPCTSYLLIELIKGIVGDISRESNQAPNEHGHHDKSVNWNSSPVDESDFWRLNTRRS
jgi:hypothetical protein